MLMPVDSRRAIMSFTCKHLLVQHQNKKLVDISFSFERSFALIGQSGSGKSLTLKALLGMLPQSLEVSLSYDASYPLTRGKTVAFVPQNPFTALSPLTKIEKQFGIEKECAQNYLEMVELDSSLLERFPSELSGGQLQRVIIAMALSLKPQLLLLDEPTTALDEENKERILLLIKRLAHTGNFDIFFVTHDLDSIEGICEEVGILQNGLMVEKGWTRDILQNPQQAYTQELLRSGFKQRSFRA